MTEDETLERQSSPAVIDLQQRQIARAIANIAMQMTAAVAAAKERDTLQLDLLLAILTEKRAERERKDSDDYTDKFNLPGGTGKLELTRRTQRKIIAWALAALGIAATHVAHYLLLHH